MNALSLVAAIAYMNFAGFDSPVLTQSLAEKFAQTSDAFIGVLHEEKQSPASNTFNYSALLPAVEIAPAETKGKRIIRFSVEVEEGVHIATLNASLQINAILSSPRSWSGRMPLKFAYTTPERADMRILLASPETVDWLCHPLRTNSVLSCRNGSLLVINELRWMLGVRHWTASLDLYRAYLINHEAGHFLGRPHEPCKKHGAPAPVMMQQSKYTGGCKPNGWPYPEDSGVLLADRG